MSILNELLAWNPRFLAGFSLNLSISLVAMILGTFIGWLLGLGRLSGRKSIALTHGFATGIFRNIPSFIFMFYIAFILPVEFDWQGEQVRFPAWIKASIALMVPVIGFASDQFYRLIPALKQPKSIALPMFFVAWTQYFLIILMASSTASVIGVPEIVSRANTAIAVTGDPSLMLWIYLYVALWFLCAATIINGSLKWLTSYIKSH